MPAQSPRNAFGFLTVGLSRGIKAQMAAAEQDPQSPLEMAARACEAADPLGFAEALAAYAEAADEAEAREAIARSASAWLRLALDPEASCDVRLEPELRPARAPADPARLGSLLDGVILASKEAGGWGEPQRRAIVAHLLRSADRAIEGDGSFLLGICASDEALAELPSPRWRQVAWLIGRAGHAALAIACRDALPAGCSLEGEEMIQSAFLGAAAVGQREAAEALLGAGADVNGLCAARAGLDGVGGSALVQAVGEGNFEAAEWLLSIGATAFSPDQAFDAILRQPIVDIETAHNLLARGQAHLRSEDVERALGQCAEQLDGRRFGFFLAIDPEAVAEGDPTDALWRRAARGADPKRVADGRWESFCRAAMRSGLKAPSANALRQIHEAFSKFGREREDLMARARGIEAVARAHDEVYFQEASLMAAADEMDLLRRSWAPRSESRPGSRPPHGADRRQGQQQGHGFGRALMNGPAGKAAADAPAQASADAAGDAQQQRRRGPRGLRR